MLTRPEIRKMVPVKLSPRLQELLALVRDMPMDEHEEELSKALLVPNGVKHNNLLFTQDQRMLIFQALKKLENNPFYDKDSRDLLRNLAIVVRDRLTTQQHDRKRHEKNRARRQLALKRDVEQAEKAGFANAPHTPNKLRGIARSGLKFQLWEKTKGRCFLCGHPAQLPWGSLHKYSPTIEHIVPMCQGGTNVIDNLTMSHKICNEDKSVLDRSKGYPVGLITKEVERALKRLGDRKRLGLNQPQDDTRAERAMRRLP